MLHIHALRTRHLHVPLHRSQIDAHHHYRNVTAASWYALLYDFPPTYTCILISDLHTCASSDPCLQRHLIMTHHILDRRML